MPQVFFLPCLLVGLKICGSQQRECSLLNPPTLVSGSITYGYGISAANLTSTSFGAKKQRQRILRQAVPSGLIMAAMCLWFMGWSKIQMVWLQRLSIRIQTAVKDRMPVG